MKLENKRILFVIARLNRGGTSKYIGELVPALLSEGLEVLTATGFVQGNEVEDSVTERIPIVRIKNLGRKISLLSDLKARSEIKKVIKTFKPDLIYTHTFKAGLLTRTIFTFRPIVHAYHGLILDDEEHSKAVKFLYRLIERTLAVRTKYIVSVGRRVGEELRAFRIGNSKKIMSIPPGVSQVKLLNKNESLKKLRLSEEGLKIAWLGRLEEVKKASRVLELARQMPGSVFLIAGDGSQKVNLEGSATDNVLFMGWQDPLIIFSVSDIVLNTSLSEGMSIALIESQMAGLPAVAMNVGSNAEIVRHGITGYLSSEFPEPFLTYLRKLVLEPSLRTKMAQSANEWATSEFSIQLFVQRHLQLFYKSF